MLDTRYPLVSVLSLLLGAGCLTPSSAPCASDAQCYADQICVDEVCVDGARGDAGTLIEDDSGGGGGGGGGDDDSGGGGGGGDDDAGEEPAACLMSGVCARDDDYEKNGDFAHTIYAAGNVPAGCTMRRSGEVDRFVQANIVGKVCRSDFRGDAYAIPWQQCGSVGFTIRAELEITTPCPEDLYTVEFREDNCETGFFVCDLEEVGPGHWIWSVTLPQNSDSGLSNNLVIDIEPKTGARIGLDYTLDVTTTQLTE